MGTKMVNFDKVWNRTVPSVKGFRNQMVPLGERLKEERQRLGLNQTEFGQKVGVTKKTQGLYEQGDRSPNAEYMAAFAQMGGDILFVLTGERSPEIGLNPKEQMIIYNFRALSEEDRAAVQRLTDALAKSPDDNHQNGGRKAG